MRRSVPFAPDDRAAVRSAITVGLAASTAGVSFGALAVTAGLSVWQACVLSLLMFTGGSQFALIGVLASGGLAAGPSAILGAAVLGLRNGIYAVRLSTSIGPGMLRRLLAAHLTIDESTAVAVAQPTPRSRRIGFWVTGGVVFLGWNLATLAGGLLGDAMGDTRRFGLDAAAAAVFLGLIWPRLQNRQAAAVAAGAAVVAAATLPLLPAGVPVLVAGVVALLVGGFNRFGAGP